MPHVFLPFYFAVFYIIIIFTVDVDRFVLSYSKYLAFLPCRAALARRIYFNFTTHSVDMFFFDRDTNHAGDSVSHWFI